MDFKDIDKFEFKRINPFPGLVIDADVWRDAHSYHRDQLRLHNLALHGAGIVVGLEVTANQPPDLSVRIQPGVGIDPEGNIILFSKAQNYRLQSREKGVIYLIIQFREIPTGPKQPPEGGQPTRILEAYQIQERDSLPKEPYLELARIDFDPVKSVVLDAKDPSYPGQNEIDLRFRQQVETKVGLPQEAPAKRKLALGYISLTQEKDLHRAGLVNLVREINRSTNYQATFHEIVSLTEAIRGCDLLYIVGKGAFEIDARAQRSLAAFAREGGMIIGEGCAQGPEGNAEARDFGIAFNRMVQQLGYTLQKIGHGHPILTSCHVFAAVPAGANPDGLIMVGRRIIYSGSDYGCAWSGGYLDNPLHRDTIRGAFEMGVNIITYLSAV